VSILRNNLVNC